MRAIHKVEALPTISLSPRAPNFSPLHTSYLPYHKTESVCPLIHKSVLLNHYPFRMAFPAAPEPKSLLGNYRLLAPNASVRVSPLCLGAMNFGTAWEQWLGKCDKDTSFEILDYFFGTSLSCTSCIF